MQNPAIAALGLNWRYIALSVHPDRLAQAILGAQEMGFIGLNLTVPHKQLAYELVDVLDPSAQEWGAVNTIKFEALDSQGEWVSVDDSRADQMTQRRAVGYNTDADAVIRACREDLGVEFAQAKVVVSGVGGAGRVAALRIASEGVGRLYLINRTVEKAEAVREEIAERYPSVDVQIGYPGEGVDLLINGTSVGLKLTDPVPLDLTQIDLTRVSCVYDMIYQPAETKLLALAKESGCRVANGLGMLVYQGAKALEIWTGKPVPADVMRDALEKHIYG